MTDQNIMHPCFMCGSQFQMGEHIYDGKYIRRYDITVCMACWDGNWDGWTPDYETRLIAHLENEGILIPERNEKGWLPRE